MAYQIVWTAEADNDFKNIILYLKENWSQQSSEKFIQRTYTKLDKLSLMPSVARSTPGQTFIYKLDRKNVIFFILEENHLVILSIYPFKKDITKSKYY